MLAFVGDIVNAPVLFVAVEPEVALGDGVLSCCSWVIMRPFLVVVFHAVPAGFHTASSFIKGRKNWMGIDPIAPLRFLATMSFPSSYWVERFDLASGRWMKIILSASYSIEPESRRSESWGSLNFPVRCSISLLSWDNNTIGILSSIESTLSSRVM